MAAAFTVVMRCRECGIGEVSITNTQQVTAGDWGGKPDRFKCPYCKANMNVAFKSIAITHSGDVGANQTVTHTITEPGTISSAASNPA